MNPNCHFGKTWKCSRIHRGWLCGASAVADSAGPDLAETALACSVYVDAARREFHRQCWQQLVGHEP